MTPVQYSMRTNKNPPTTLHPTLRILPILIFICIIVVLNCTPPVSRDALTHHLAIPKLYLVYGGIYEIPALLFSYYPMNLEFLYLVPLWFGNDIIPKFIHMFFGLATAWLIFSYLKKQIGANWGLFGALFFLTTPIIIHLSTSAYVDLGVSFFTTASLLLLLQWRKSEKTSLLLLAGICAGLAAGTKYNGLITLFLLTCFVPFLTKKGAPHDTQIKVKALLVFIFPALVAVSPWLIRNILWTGNPVFPLFPSVFNGGETSITQGMNPLLIRKLVYHEPLWQTLLIPIRIFLEGQDNNPQYFDGVLNPFILLFSLVAFFPQPKNSTLRTDKKIFLWFIILFLLFAFIQRVIRIRYIVPALPFLIILSTFGIHQIQSFLAQKKSVFPVAAIPWLLLFTAFLFNGNYLLNHWQNIRPLEYLSGETSRTAFISRFWQEYPLVDYANKTLPQSADILAVFLGNRGYYFDRSVRFDLKKGKSLLYSLAKEQPDENAIAISLQETGITHLLIREDLFQQNSKHQLTLTEQQRLSLFVQKHTKRIAATRNHSLRTLIATDAED